jgi:hypothetical protein
MINSRTVLIVTLGTLLGDSQKGEELNRTLIALKEGKKSMINK